MVQIMSTDIRNRLIDRMRTELEKRTANLPDSIPISVPIGPLADVIIDEMAEGGGVPLIPEYDQEIWSMRRWTQPFTSDEAMEGKVSDIQVHLDPEDPERVRFMARGALIPAHQGSANGTILVSLPADSAEEFLVAGLAAVRAARAEAS
jgi:hypothetical protein